MQCRKISRTHAKLFHVQSLFLGTEFIQNIMIEIHSGFSHVVKISTKLIFVSLSLYIIYTNSYGSNLFTLEIHASSHVFSLRFQSKWKIHFCALDVCSFFVYVVLHSHTGNIFQWKIQISFVPSFVRWENKIKFINLINCFARAKISH